MGFSKQGSEMSGSIKTQEFLHCNFPRRTLLPGCVSKDIRPDMCPQMLLQRKPTDCFIPVYMGFQVLRELRE